MTGFHIYSLFFITSTCHAQLSRMTLWTGDIEPLWRWSALITMYQSGFYSTNSSQHMYEFTIYAYAWGLKDYSSGTSRKMPEVPHIASTAKRLFTTSNTTSITICYHIRNMKSKNTLSLRIKLVLHRHLSTPLYNHSDRG